MLKTTFKNVFNTVYKGAPLEEHALGHKILKRSYLKNSYDLNGSGVTQTLRFTQDTSDVSVQEPRTCSTWGQGAFKTYTDDFYYFTSNCKYILSRQCKGDKEDFNVEILRGSHGKLEHIFMKIEDTSIIVANGTIKVKNKVVSLPYNDKLINIEQYGIEVRFSNKKHTIYLTWNYNDALSITVDVQYQGKLCGLCGPFDESVSTIHNYQYTLQAKLGIQHHCTTVFPEEATCESIENIYTINNDGTVQNNGNAVELPLGLGNGDIMIFEQSSHYIQIHAKSGLEMQIQISPIMQLYLSLPRSAQGSTKGLCGTFNDNAEDDFLSAQNIVEPTFIPFSDSRKDNEKCPLPKVNPICISSENENFAKEQCAYLKDPTGAFSKCHAMVEFDKYYEMCKAASCHCQKVSDCVCAALGAYTHACASKGIIVKNWRRSVCRITCPSTQIYLHDVRTCNRTCQFLSNPDFTCELQDAPVDGCGCAEGLYMNDKKACIARNKIKYFQIVKLLVYARGHVKL
ncbi:mucin-6-like [Mobula hypostoma]|uniref:mucin-6-like n=1 Tax=Mobula hypostoma TaxID=723540 RepID=UPI002FC28A5D